MLHTRASPIKLTHTHVRLSALIDTELKTKHILRHNCAHSKMNFSAFVGSWFFFPAFCFAFYTFVRINVVRGAFIATERKKEREPGDSNGPLHFCRSMVCVLRNIWIMYENCSKRTALTRLNPNINGTVIRFGLHFCTQQKRSNNSKTNVYRLAVLLQRTNAQRKNAARTRMSTGREREGQMKINIAYFIIIICRTVTVPIWKGRTRIAYLLPAKRDPRFVFTFESLKKNDIFIFVIRMENAARRRDRTESLVSL